MINYYEDLQSFVLIVSPPVPVAESSNKGGLAWWENSLVQLTDQQSKITMEMWDDVGLKNDLHGLRQQSKTWRSLLVAVFYVWSLPNWLADAADRKSTSSSNFKKLCVSASIYSIQFYLLTSTAMQDRQRSLESFDLFVRPTCLDSSRGNKNRDSVTNEKDSPNQRLACARATDCSPSHGWLEVGHRQTYTNFDTNVSHVTSSVAKKSFKNKGKERHMNIAGFWCAVVIFKRNLWTSWSRDGLLDSPLWDILLYVSLDLSLIFLHILSYSLIFLWISSTSWLFTIFPLLAGFVDCASTGIWWLYDFWDACHITCSFVVTLDPFRYSQTLDSRGC